MDIDAMTAEERAVFMKKGLCFGCKKPGHLSRDCPNKKGYTPPKKTGKELYAHVRSLLTEIDDNEKNIFLDEAGESGF